MFLNRCVGSGNYRYFLLLLFWISVGTLYVSYVPLHHLNVQVQLSI